MTKKLLTLTFVGLSTIASVEAEYGRPSRKFFNGVDVKELAEKAKLAEQAKLATMAKSVSMDDMIAEAHKANMNQWGMHMNTTPVAQPSKIETLKDTVAKFAHKTGAAETVKKAASSVTGQTGMLAAGLGTFGLAVGTGIQKFGEYMNPVVEVPALVSTPTRVEQVKAQATQMGQKAFDYTKNNYGKVAAVAVAVPAVVYGTKVLLKKISAPQKPTVEQIKQNSKNLQALISQLRRHGYTSVNVKASDLVSPMVNETQAAFVIRCLN